MASIFRQIPRRPVVDFSFDLCSALQEKCDHFGLATPGRAYGVPPEAPMAFTSALRSNKRRTISVRPLADATDNGV
jgi:hypothetical protein